MWVRWCRELVTYVGVEFTSETQRRWRLKSTIFSSPRDALHTKKMIATSTFFHRPVFSFSLSYGARDPHAENETRRSEELLLLTLLKHILLYWKTRERAESRRIISQGKKKHETLGRLEGSLLPLLLLLLQAMSIQDMISRPLVLWRSWEVITDYRQRHAPLASRNVGNPRIQHHIVQRYSNSSDVFDASLSQNYP